MTDLAMIKVGVDTREVKQAQSDIKGLGTATGDVEKKTKESTNSMSRSFGNVSGAVRMFTGVLVAFGASRGISNSIAVTNSFTQAIADLSAITGATGKDLEYYSKQAADIGRTTSLSATQAATAFKLIASAKPDLLDNAEALNAVTRSAVTLAEATGQDLATAASALGSALNQFGLAASKADEVINMLAASSKLGTAEVGSVSEALRNAGPAANALGIDITETVAAIQALAKSGRQGADAGTGLRQVMLQLEKTGEQTLRPSLVGIDGALQELGKRNLSVADLMELVGIEAASVAAALIEQSGTVTELNTTLRGTQTAYEQADIRMNTFSGDMKGLNSAIEGLQIELMTDSVDGLGRSLINTATNGVNFLTKNLDALKTVVEVMTVLVGIKLASAFAVGLVGSVGAAMAALAATTVTTTTYNAALMVTQANIVRTTVAQNAMTIATGAANTALALIGGPIAAVVLAVGGLTYATAKLAESWQIARIKMARFNGAEFAQQELDVIGLSAEDASKNIDAAKNSLEIMTLEMASATEIYGTNSKEVETLTRKLDLMQNWLNLNKIALSEANLSAEILSESTSELSEIINEASSQITEYGKDVIFSTIAVDAHVVAQEEFLKITEQANSAIGIAEDALENHKIASMMSKKELSIFNAELDALSKEYAPEAVTELGILAGKMYDQKTAVDIWTAASKNGAQQRAEAEIESQRKQEKAMTRTHEYLTTSFIDIFNNGKNAFDNIAKAFSAMIQRMIAEWAASKLMNLIGIGSGQGGTSTSLIGSIGSLLTGGGGAGGGAAGNLISGSGGSLLAAGGQFLGGLTGTAVGTGSAIVGPPTAAAAAGAGVGGTIAGIGSTIASGVSAVGSAISGGLSSAGALIMANPLLAAAAVAALAAAALAKKPTLSSNAGLLIHDAPGASADRKFAVDPFDSGFAPIGFARREDHAAANDVIDVFRKYDSSLTEIAKAAGLNVNFSNNPFGGYNEKGQANGLFLGTAAEKGKGVTSAPIADQLTQFTKQWIEALGGQVAASDREFLLSSGSADVLLERAATLGMAKKARIDGSHADGLSMVPFDGYRAELHKGEEVLRADDPRNKNNENTSKLDQLTMQVALYTKRFSQILDDWDVRGLPPVRPT
jgi:TP901 family phage tail tape measure protein